MQSQKYTFQTFAHGSFQKSGAIIWILVYDLEYIVYGISYMVYAQFQQSGALL